MPLWKSVADQYWRSDEQQIDGCHSNNHLKADSNGFDAARGEYVNLIKAGILDLTKVVRIALENAVSVASVLLLTEATLTEIPEPKPEPAPSFESP